MDQLQTSFDELILYIELENVRKNVLFFNSSKFSKRISENGLKFSNKNHYKINEDFNPIHFEKEDVFFYFRHLANVINAFGVSFAEGMEGLFDSECFSSTNSEKLD